MPTPTIPAGNLFMNATLYTGNGTALTVTNGVAGQAFQPDFVWVKSRSAATSHYVYDVIRGTGNRLITNGTLAEAAISGVTAFNSNGFAVGTETGNNDLNGTFVGWQWKAGGAAVTNTAGSISAQVSANTTSGFSVVTYTGTGSNATVGHGLGVAPSMIIVKRRDAGSSGWSVYFITLAAGYVLSLQTTGAQANSATRFTTTLPTSTVFSIGTDSDLNASAGTYVAYCWAPIAGYSAFGSYTGNGSTDGPFIYTGFRPKFVMVKASSFSTASTVWNIWDTSRSPSNAALKELYPNSTDAEGTDSNGCDILSNGFKPRRSSDYANSNGQTYIYACWAENPFKYANAR